MQILVGSNFNFKNRIINGDMQVAQRGRMHKLEDNGDYTADRWFSEIQGGSEEVRNEFIYSPTAGNLKDETDPFGDGSQIHFYPLRDDATDKVGSVDGTVNGDVAFNNQGVYFIGDSAYFDGDVDNISIDIDPAGTYISMWVKPDADGFILDTRSDDNTGIYIKSVDNSLFLRDDDAENSFIAFINGEMFNINGAGTYIDINKSVWTHIVVYCVRGEKLNLGSDYNGENNFIGNIQQIRVFNRTLTEDEVRKLYVEDNKYIFKNHLKSIVTSNNTISKYTPFVCRFEGQHLADIIANRQKATLSFLFASNKNRDFTIRLIYPNGSEFKTYTFSYNGDKDFQRIAQTIDFSEFDLTKLVVNEDLGLELRIVDDTDLDVTDWVSVTDVQLEKGNIATEFEQIHYDIQLNRCLRYYEEGTMRKLDSEAGTYYCMQSQSYKVKKRTTPTVTFFSPYTKKIGFLYDHYNSSDVEGFAHSMTDNTTQVAIFYQSGTTRAGFYCNWTADAEL